MNKQTRILRNIERNQLQNSRSLDLRHASIILWLKSRKGEEFLIPEHMIYVIMAIVGIILLLYIVVKMAGYV